MCLNVEIRFVLIVIRRDDSDGATESCWEFNGVNLRPFKFENTINSKNITNRMLGVYIQKEVVHAIAYCNAEFNNGCHIETLHFYKLASRQLRVQKQIVSGKVVVAVPTMFSHRAGHVVQSSM